MPRAASDEEQRKVTDFSHVFAALETLCASLQVGDRLPTHKALMRQLGASERAVLRALEELQRSGNVVRKNGAGTFVTARPAGPRQSLVAVAEADQFREEGLVAELLQCTELAGAALVCRPVLNDASYSGGPWESGPSTRRYVLFGYALAPLAKRLQELGGRVVLVGAPPPGTTPEVPCVYGDEEQGGYLALRHLVDLGHRRVAIEAGAEVKRTARWEGYQRAAAQASRAGRPVELRLLPPELVNAWKTAPDQAAHYFRTPEAPTALITGDVPDALGMLLVLARAGLSVPHQVSLLACEERPGLAGHCPGLTTVDQGRCQQIRAAIRMLTAPGPPPPASSTVLIPNLVHRSSTAPPLL